jgi:hypothetical protein
MVPVKVAVNIPIEMILISNGDSNRKIYVDYNLQVLRVILYIKGDLKKWEICRI